MAFHAWCGSFAAVLIGGALESAPVIEQTGQPARPEQTSHPGTLAITNGSAIDPTELQPALAELAGAVALEEAVIDRALAAREREGTLRLGPDAEEGELRAMLTSMQDEARVGPEDAARMLADLRASRGLGPARFRALLRRNAGLRAMVAGTVEPTPEEIRLAEEREFGARYRMRLIVASDRAEIAGVADRVTRSMEAGAPGWVAFAEEAVRHSRHPTAARGGLMTDVSAADYSLPATVRAALGSTRPGTMSEVLATTDGYALLLVEQVTPGNPVPTEAQRKSVATKLQRRLERLAMDRAARELLDAARVTVFDASLRWSWENRPR